MQNSVSQHHLVDFFSRCFLAHQMPQLPEASIFSQSKDDEGLPKLDEAPFIHSEISTTQNSQPADLALHIPLSKILLKKRFREVAQRLTTDALRIHRRIVLCATPIAVRHSLWAAEFSLLDSAKLFEHLFVLKEGKKFTTTLSLWKISDVEVPSVGKAFAFCKSITQ